MTDGEERQLEAVQLNTLAAGSYRYLSVVSGRILRASVGAIVYTSQWCASF